MSVHLPACNPITSTPVNLCTPTSPTATEGDGRYLCNHRRGYKYYLDSVAPVCRFPAFVCRDYETFLQGDCFPCQGCGNMGYFANQAEGRGQLYLVTRDTEPFCGRC